MELVYFVLPHVTGLVLSVNYRLCGLFTFLLIFEQLSNIFLPKLRGTNNFFIIHLEQNKNKRHTERNITCPTCLPGVGWAGTGVPPTWDWGTLARTGVVSQPGLGYPPECETEKITSCSTSYAVGNKYIYLMVA